MNNLLKLSISHTTAAIFVVLCLASTVYLQTGEGWKWRVAVKNDSYPTPFTGKNNLYFEDGEFVVALDARTGREKWRYKSRPGAYLSEEKETAGRLILLESYNGGGSSETVADNIVGLDAESGKEVWRKDYDGSRIEQMAISGDVVYFDVENIGLAALKAANGEVVWESDACPDVFGTPFINGKSIYVQCFGGKIYSIDAASGKLQWKAGTRGSISGGFEFSADSMFYTHSNKRSAKLFALDKNDGLEKWNIPAADGYTRQTFAGNLLITNALKNAPVHLSIRLRAKLSANLPLTENRRSRNRRKAREIISRLFQRPLSPVHGSISEAAADICSPSNRRAKKLSGIENSAKEKLLRLSLSAERLTFLLLKMKCIFWRRSISPTV